MSWEFTAEYYRLANVAVRDRLGGLHSARIVSANVDFADVEALRVAGHRRSLPAGAGLELATPE
jgi:aspartate racemase